MNQVLFAHLADMETEVHREEGSCPSHPVSDRQSGTIPGLLLHVRVPEPYALEYLLE